MSTSLYLIGPSRLADAARPYEILLDGKIAGEIRNNMNAEVSLEAGTHSLEIRLPKMVKISNRRPGLSSQPMTFEVDVGEVAAFKCYRPPTLQAFFMWIVRQLGRRNRWISLERIQ